MLDFIYTLIIYPIEQIIELSYGLSFKTFHNDGMAILCVSVLVSIVTLPLYFMAEKHQQTERNIQKRLKPKIDKIKAVFHGDEQYMILSSYYRQNNYHPIYALRSSIGLLIQIPFFIAAYSYLSNFAALKGYSFLFIRDLGSPDHLLSFNGFAINILPILMTIINIAGGAVYTKGFPLKEKIQLYGMAIIFLLLLYNSPSGLVLYWTANNTFSLVKNCLQKTKYSKKIVYCVVAVCVLSLDIYLLFFHHGYLHNRLILLFAATAVLFFPFIKNMLPSLTAPPPPQNLNKPQTRNFLLSCVILFLLAGFIIPCMLIASSVEEFSFVEGSSSPFPIIFWTTLQAAGFFLLLPISLYFLFQDKIKQILTVLFSCFFVIALINTFIFSGDYGTLDTTFHFDKDIDAQTSALGIAVNLFTIIAAAVAVIFFLFSKHGSYFFPIQTIIILALFVFGIFNCTIIYREYYTLKQNRTSELTQNINENTDDIFNPVFYFSRTANNVVHIMLDRAISGYFPYILDEKPDLKDAYNGFVYYPNCVSFGGRTMYGAAPVFGGYEYAPIEMQLRKNETLVDKKKEAALVLPKMFSSIGWNVVVVDSPLAGLPAFSGMPNTRTEIIKERYTQSFLDKNPGLELSITPLQKLWKSRFIRLDFFKFLPLFLRSLAYNGGDWLTIKFSNLKKSFVDNYAMMEALPYITQFDDSPVGRYNIFDNDLPHEPQYLQLPEYVPSSSFSTEGGAFHGENHYHVNAASLLLLAKWFDVLKENGVWDNTRIIITSDHGDNIFSKFPNNIKLPNGDCVELYNPLFLFKDFNSQGQLVTDNAFMTHADAPLLAIKDIFENPVNPFTGKPLEAPKENGITITSSNRPGNNQNGTYQFTIKSNEWLNVRSSIFDPSNWEVVTISLPE